MGRASHHARTWVQTDIPMRDLRGDEARRGTGPDPPTRSPGKSIALVVFPMLGLHGKGTCREGVMASIEVECTFCKTHGKTTILTRSPGQIAKNKSQTYFCNEQEQQAWARETGGHTRGGHITIIAAGGP